MNAFFTNYNKSLEKAIQEHQVTAGAGRSLSAKRGLELLCAWTESVRDTGRTMYFIGNGASACMASHMAADWAKNAGVRALAYNDIAFLSANGNDFGYDEVFAQPVQWFGERGDLLATISSSGNSPNVVKAIAAAQQKGMRVVTFSGMRPKNASRRAGDLNFYVPGWTYGMVECAHQVPLHAWLDCFMGVCEWDLTAPQVITPPRRRNSAGIRENGSNGKCGNANKQFKDDCHDSGEDGQPTIEEEESARTCRGAPDRAGHSKVSSGRRVR